MKRTLIFTTLLLIIAVSAYGQDNSYDFLPMYMKDRISEYDKIARELKEPLFTEKFGIPNKEIYISGYVTKDDAVEICYLNDGKGSPKHILVGAKRKKGNDVFILSSDSKISKEQEDIYPIRNSFMGLFPINKG